MAFCSNCGANIAEESGFCSKCGKPVGQGAGGGAATAAAPAATSAGLAENVASALCYLFIPAIIFLCIEPYNKNKTIRFHAFQDLGLAIISIVGHIILGMVPVLGWVLMPIFSLLIFIVAVICAVKAYQGGKFKIPVVGEQAEKMANQ